MTEFTINPDRYAAINLAKGAHSSPDEGMCLLELTAFLVGEQHSDRPKCVSAVLGEFGRGLNDCLPDGRRQELVALIPSLPGTADDGMDEARSYMALDWLIRTWLPAWLELSPACREDAAKVRDLGRIVDLVSAERAGPVVRSAGKTADAAWVAARVAAWVAARVAAWDAARVAAWVAAWVAAGDAAWVAARVAAGDAAWVAAWVAAGDAAWVAAGDAAWVAAGDAAWAALAPTVDALQLSAIDLYADMIKAPNGGAA